MLAPQRARRPRYQARRYRISRVSVGAGLSQIALLCLPQMARLSPASGANLEGQRPSRGTSPAPGEEIELWLKSSPSWP